MPRHHTLSSATVHHAWDKSIPPMLTIDSGDRVTFACRNAADMAFTLDSTIADYPRSFLGHPLTGPVWVNGAAPGDALEIELLELTPGAVGWTVALPDAGLLAGDDFTPTLKVWDLTLDPTPFLPGIAIPQEPFLGVMARSASLRSRRT